MTLMHSKVCQGLGSGMRHAGLLAHLHGKQLLLVLSGAFPAVASQNVCCETGHFQSSMWDSTDHYSAAVTIAQLPVTETRYAQYVLFSSAADVKLVFTDISSHSCVPKAEGKGGGCPLKNNYKIKSHTKELSWGVFLLPNISATTAGFIKLSAKRRFESSYSSMFSFIIYNEQSNPKHQTKDPNHKLI